MTRGGELRDYAAHVIVRSSLVEQAMTAISINALTETLLDFYLGDAESSKDEDHGSTLHFLSPSVGSSKTTAKPAIYGINWLFADQIAGGRWWLRRCGGCCRNGS